MGTTVSFTIEQIWQFVAIVFTGFGTGVLAVYKFIDSRTDKAVAPLLAELARVQARHDALEIRVNTLEKNNISARHHVQQAWELSVRGSLPVIADHLKNALDELA